MMNDSEALLSLRVALREGQDSGQLPYTIEVRRRFHVMVGEIGVPILRDLVNLLCVEGVTAHLLMGMDEATPYIGIQLERPETTLWISPATTGRDVLSSVHGGLYPEYASLRTLSFRVLMRSTLEAVLVEQLRLVLCPPQPIV
ncbi:MAG: hypothetical protein E8D44_00035 [Nitrospira sp.]|nr:MAG: hypothetical protein E8D44_00035 [Nitrospira sp.]